MIEVLGTDLQTALPYIGAVMGAGIGAALEYPAQSNVQNSRRTIVTEHAAIFPDYQESRFHKIGRHVIAPLTIFGMGMGLAGGMVWQSEPVEQTVPPQLEVVVDHSKATTLGDGNAAVEINKITSRFTDKSRVKTRAYIARNSAVKETEIKDVTKTEYAPFGYAPLDTATQSALDNAQGTQVKISAGHAQNAGVLALTNGNSLGNPMTIIRQSLDTNVPVFVVNVEDKGANPAVAAELKLIAEKTHAKYWDANVKNIDQVSSKIEGALVANKVHHKDTSDKWPLRTLQTLITVAGLGLIYKKRATMTLGNEVKKG